MGRVARAAECHPEREHEAKGMCRPCYKATRKVSNTPEVAAYHKAYREANRDKLRKQEWEARNVSKDGYLDSRYRREYGMSLEDVKSMLESQHHACAVCNRSIDIDSKCIDHCHTTGYVRGLLCKSCNMGLGLFKDNADALKRAAEYVSNATTGFKGTAM